MDTNSILLVAVICVVIGFLIGGLVSGLGNKTESNDERKALLKAWRDPEKDNLVIEIEGKEFDHSVQLNARQRSLLGKVILEINQWLGTISSPRQAAGSLRLPPDPPQEVAQTKESQPRMSLNPVNILSNALKADIQKSQLPTESIVDQIDVILQEKLRRSPLKDEGVRLMEWPGKGMVVMVGMDKYDNVEDVPDDLIQEMIHAAVKEWEQQGLDEN